MDLQDPAAQSNMPANTVTKADIEQVRRLIDDFVHDATQLVHRQDAVEGRLVNVENSSITMAAAARAMPALASKVADAMAHSVNAVEAKDAAKAAVEELFWLQNMVLDNWCRPWRILRALKKRRQERERPLEKLEATPSWGPDHDTDLG